MPWEMSLILLQVFMICRRPLTWLKGGDKRDLNFLYNLVIVMGSFFTLVLTITLNIIWHP